MFEVKGKDIYITRGDTGQIGLDLFYDADGSPYEYHEGDKFYFTVKERVGFMPSFKKELGQDLTIFLEHADTDHLKMPLDYVYDIQYVNHDGSVVDTFLSGVLHVLSEVGTWKDIH